MLGFGFQRKQSLQDEEDSFNNEAYEREKEVRGDQINNDLFADYGDDFDDYVQKHSRKLFNLVTLKTNDTLRNFSDRGPHMQDFQAHQREGIMSEPQEEPGRVNKPLQMVQVSNPHVQQNRTKLKPTAPVQKLEQIKPKRKVRPATRNKVESFENPEQIKSSFLANKEQFKGRQQPAALKEQETLRSHKTYNTQIQKMKDLQFQTHDRDAPLLKATTAANEESHTAITRRNSNYFISKTSETYSNKALREKEIEMNMPLQDDLNNRIHKVTAEGKIKKRDERGEGGRMGEKYADRTNGKTDVMAGERSSLWDQQEELPEVTDDDDSTPAPVFDTQVYWNQTFQVSHLDLQAQRSDWIDLTCNVSGNLLLHSSDAIPMVNAFMDQLNEKHKGYAFPSVCLTSLNGLFH